MANALLDHISLTYGGGGVGGLTKSGKWKGNSWNEATLARAGEQFVDSTVWTIRVSVFEATLGELFFLLFLHDKEQIIHNNVNIMNTAIIVVMTIPGLSNCLFSIWIYMCYMIYEFWKAFSDDSNIYLAIIWLTYSAQCCTRSLNYVISPKFLNVPRSISLRPSVYKNRAGGSFDLIQ